VWRGAAAAAAAVGIWGCEGRVDGGMLQEGPLSGCLVGCFREIGN